ncbi:MAG: ABC transporter ATP-binding protein [Chloroflexi bacterium]|nr:ABC transporter ATP-binding protein [Chloroflexota bacterium]
MTELIRVESLAVSYNGRTIVHIPHLVIDEGEVFTILGPNGSGKSTLLRVLSLIEKPSGGEVFFHGEKITRNSNLLHYRRRMAMVFQESLLYSTSVSDNVAMGLRFRRCPGGEIRRRVEAWLAKLGLEAVARQPASTLSGGEAQRVALARALVLEPKVLFLDEPFAELDPLAKQRLIEDLKRLLREASVTTVFITHDRMEALLLSRRMAVMDQGRILQVGSPEEVFNRPASEMVASFIGVETVLPGRIISCHDRLVEVEVAPDRRIEGVANGLTQGEVLVCIRPEEVTLIPWRGDQPRSSARNSFRGRIISINDLGPYYKVVLDCGFPLVAFVTRLSASELGFGEGGLVTASFKATAIHIITKG